MRLGINLHQIAGMLTNQALVVRACRLIVRRGGIGRATLRAETSDSQR